MNKTMTKVLSFVLALALVAAFAPAGVISNADAAIGDATEYLISAVANTTRFNAAYATNWSYNSYSGDVGINNVKVTSGRLPFKALSVGYESVAPENSYIAMNITLPTETGVYSLAANVLEGYGASTIDAYVFSSSETGATGIKAENKLGTATIPTTESGDYFTFEGGSITVNDDNAGKTVAVALQGATVGSVNGGAVGDMGFYFYGLKLTKTADVAVVPSATYDFTKVSTSSTTIQAVNVTALNAYNNPNWTYNSTSVTAANAKFRYGKLWYTANLADDYFAINIVLPSEPGVYSLTSKLDAASGGAASFNAYIFPTGTAIAEGIDNANKVGTAARADTMTFGDFKVTKASAGTTVVLAINAAEAGASAPTHGGYIYSFKLTKTGELPTELDRVEASVPVKALASGTTTVSAKAYMTDSTEATGAAITFASSDAAIATVDKDTGVVTQVGSGNVVITATATLNGVTATAKVKLYCGTEIVWAGADETVVYNFGDATGTLNDGTTTGTNWRDAGLSYIMTATSTNGNNYKSGRANYWASHAGNIFAPIVTLPSLPGKYTISLKIEPNYGGKEINLYLWPKNITETNPLPMSSEYFLGSTLIESDATNVVAVIEVTPEMAGNEYILGVNSTVSGTNSSFTQFYGFIIYNVTFAGTGTELLKTVSLTDSDVALNIGDSEDLVLVKKLSDGTDATAANVTWSSSTDNVTVDNGKITAVKAGNAVITARITCGDIVREAKTLIEVAAPVVASDFEGNVSSGYYAADAEAAAEEGIIAFNALFNKYATIEIDSYGFWVYEEGNADAELDNGKIEVKSVDGTLADGWFHTTVTGIAVEDFDRVAVAVPFVVIDEVVYFGNAISSSTAANWLGAKA